MRYIITAAQLSILINEQSEKLPTGLNQEFEISYNYDSKVAELQKLLKDKNFYLGNFGPNKDGIDGKYGPFTKAAHVAIKQGMSPNEFSDKREDLAQEFIGDVNDSTLTNEFNFHKIPDGKNNYRSAQIPVTIKGKDFLSNVIDKYGIKTIIRFNGDGKDSKHHSTHPETSIQSEKNLAESKGVKFYNLSSTRDQDKVNSLLSQGNVLIHCAHGADRTGGNVGGYLSSIGYGDTQKIWNYTTQYNGWNSMVKNNPNGFVNGGYLRQAQKFGVRDLEHAKQLLSKKTAK
jgi:protein tyrosine/serine phosphatase